jgi:hypothetical protein
MVKDGVWTYTYDVEGNLIKRSKGANSTTWTYLYDERNQLHWVRRHQTDGGPAKFRVRFSYDALGNRVTKMVDLTNDGDWEGNERYLYDGGASADSRFTSSGNGNEHWNVWGDLRATDNTGCGGKKGTFCFSPAASRAVADWPPSPRRGNP